MKEHPIIFSAPMVRAILDGTKTQTRRAVKVKPHYHIEERDDGTVWPWMYDADRDSDSWMACPYGQTGDRLWVREAWRIGAWDEHRPAFALDYCDGPRKEWVDAPDPTSDDDLFSRLWQQSIDDAIKDHGCKDRYQWEPGQSPCRWRPSIHMPRWASRITLEITGVRVERLQDISEADATAEGIDPTQANKTLSSIGTKTISGPVAEYSVLWESINGPGSWDANPWVWVVEFKRVEGGAA